MLDAAERVGDAVLAAMADEQDAAPAERPAAVGAAAEAVVGVAVGNAVAGVLVEAADWRVSFLVGAGCATIGSALAFARRGTLSPVAA